MNELQRKQFSSCVRLVEEVVTGQRKGVPESRYVAEIPQAAEYWCETSQDIVAVPSEFTGHWMLKFSGDLRYVSFNAAWLSDDWVKCEKRRVETFEWVQMGD